MTPGPTDTRTAPEPGAVIAGHRIVEVLRHSEVGMTFRTEAPDGTGATMHLLRNRGSGGAERFAINAKLLSGLTDRTLPRVLGFGEAPEGLWLATAEVQGVSLRSLLAEGITPMRAVWLLGEVADALDAAHGVGLTHGDVRPENVLVRRRPVEGATLVDFRLAPANGPVAAERVSYTAPEVLGGAEPRPAADVFALAATLYECLAGTPPFGREHTRTAPKPLGPPLPGSLNATIARGLAAEPSARPASAAELIREAATLFLSAGAPAPATTPPPAPAPAAKPRPAPRPATKPPPPPAPAPATKPPPAPAKRPTLPPAPVFATKRPPAPAPATTPRPAPVSASPPPQVRRRRRLLGVLVAVLVVGAAGTAGYLTSRDSDPDEPVAPRSAASDALRMTVPEGWSRSDATEDDARPSLTDAISLRSSDPPGRIRGGLAEDRPAVLNPSRLAADVGLDSSRPRHVSLGRLQALRFDGTGRDGTSILYVAPTSAGAAAVVCAGSRESLAGPCADAARGLAVRGARGYDPAAGIAWTNKLAGDMRRLRARRARGLRRLRREPTAGGQARRAAQIAGTYAATARRLRRRSPPPQAAQARRRLLTRLLASDRAYRSLATAARATNQPGFRRATRRVRAADRRLQRTLRGI